MRKENYLKYQMIYILREIIFIIFFLSMNRTNKQSVTELNHWG